ncbi:MAG: SagB/ThcOx family dehydrogenase [Candidatus Rifleibacteriota bacterium]
MRFRILVALLILILFIVVFHKKANERIMVSYSGPPIMLAEPAYSGIMTLEQALKKRRSVRQYASTPLELAEVGQILWATQGVSSEKGGYRTAPSAGALYPLETYLVAGEVRGLQPGIYHYDMNKHCLFPMKSGDFRSGLSNTVLGQKPPLNAPASVVLAGVFERTRIKYGYFGDRYVYMEAGHAGQNLCLQAVGLGLSALTIGSIEQEKLQALLGLPVNQTPLYVLPFGHKKEDQTGILKP